MIKKFKDIPEYLQIFFKKRHGNNYDFEHLVTKKIMAFQDKSIVEVLNEPRGEERVINLLNEETGHIGGPYMLRKPTKKFEEDQPDNKAGE